ncbi:sulfurtransferase [Pararhizobium gei]|uniref:sulfurtransferase n=1 Tax=Pararhizobium gei TaxID=1395951 RepID=UPI0023D9E070|nr:rhodanese-like domain-containing protein [Rhizobium gei]
MPVLISATELLARLGEDRLVLVDVRPEADWRASTLPGAVSLNVYDYFIPESDEAGIAGMAAGTLAAFKALSIDTAKTTVFFENQTGMISPRGLWFHELVGLEGGLILDGGYQAWIAAGGTVAPGKGEPATITQSKAPMTADDFHRELVASTAEVLDHDPSTTDIFDARRLTEFEGTFLHPCCARPGRIPDAKFMYFEDMLVDGHYRPAADIRARALDAGLSPDHTIISYCHRGARAATALYGLRMAGFKDVRIFVGSWHEWAGNSALPLHIGPCEAA